MRVLTLLETRVLGVLIEKERTVPDSYPLSLNSLTNGCNQKSSRDPVLNAQESEVQACADALKQLSLVMESSGSRTTRYEHNLGRVLQIPSQSVAILAVLMLRGPQTPGELRTNTERLHAFGDLSSVQGFLDELANRAEDKGGPLVVQLPRAPGAREARWAHLLSGPVQAQAAVHTDSVDSADAVSLSEIVTLKQRVQDLEATVSQLQAQLAHVRKELGLG